MCVILGDFANILLERPFPRWPRLACGKAPSLRERRPSARARGIERSNTTHGATRWAKGVRKWWNPAVYLPKPTVGSSVSACFAVRQIGVGEHDDLVIAGAVAACWWGDVSRHGGSVKDSAITEHPKHANYNVMMSPEFAKSARSSWSSRSIGPSVIPSIAP